MRTEERTAVQPPEDGADSPVSAVRSEHCSTHRTIVRTKMSSGRSGAWRRPGPAGCPPQQSCLLSQEACVATELAHNESVTNAALTQPTSGDLKSHPA